MGRNQPLASSSIIGLLPTHEALDRLVEVAGISNMSGAIAFNIADHNTQTKIWCSRMRIKTRCEIQAIGLNQEANSTDGSGSVKRSLKIAMYDVDSASGLPTRKIADSDITWQIPTASGFQSIRTTYTNKPIIGTPRDIIIACQIAPDGWTAGGFTGWKCGWQPQYTRLYDFGATISGHTYAAGLPELWSSLSSPSYTNYVSTSTANLRMCNAPWILFVNEF